MQHFLWLLVAAIFLSCVLYASSASKDRYEFINKRYPDGSYYYTAPSEEVTGTLKDVNGTKVYSVEGSYYYIEHHGALGLGYTVKYIADENGFQVLSIDKEYIPSPIAPKSIASLLGG